MDKHLAALKPPLTLHYRYHQGGTLEAPFDDSVDMKLTARTDGACCAASTRLFSGTHALHPPEVDSADTLVQVHTPRYLSFLAGAALARS